MRRLILVLPMLLSAAVLTAAVPARAVTSAQNLQTPCDSRVLMATNDATASSLDANADRLECWLLPERTQVGDNSPRLDSPVAGPNSRKFYSYGPTWPRPGLITFVDTDARTFSGYMEGQEDDPDFVGCQGLCFETLSYDANDYFYLDTGSGSTQVTMAYFASHILGLNQFSMVYSQVSAESSVFSFRDVGGGSTTKPGQPSLRVDSVGATTIRLAWSPPSPSEGGTPTSYTFGWRSSAGDSWSKNYPAGDTRITSPFTLTGLTPGTTYTITLVAFDNAGAGPAAQQTASTTGAATPPPPVVAGPMLPARPGFLAARPGNHKAFLRWSAPLVGQPIDAYQVHRKGRTYLVAGSARSTTIRGLVNHRLYGFVVRAHNAAGWGPWSGVAKVRPHRR